MSKRNLLIAILLCVLVLLLIVGCTVFDLDATQVTTPSTEPSSEATAPTSVESMLTMERIKTHVTEALTYTKAKEILGMSDKEISFDPINQPQYIWYLDEDGYEGAYLQVDFCYPGDPYYRFEEWCESLKLPAELINGSADYYHYLGIWIGNLQVTNAMIRKDGQTLDVLLGVDYYAPSPPTEPTETVCPRTIEFFKSHLTPYMTYSQAREIFGRWDNDLAGSNNYKSAIWDLEDGYYIEVAFYPTANEHMDEYLATAPTDETNPDGTPLDELYYFKEWNYHMKAYRAELCKNNPFQVIEVWFEYPNPWVPEE